MACSGKCVI